MKNLVTSANRIHVGMILGGRSNVYLVRGQGSAVLVDSGPPGCWPALRKSLSGMGVEHLDVLILTPVQTTIRSRGLLKIITFRQTR